MADLAALLPAVDQVDREQRAEDLDRERVFGTDAPLVGEQQTGAGRDAESGQLGDTHRIESDEVRVHVPAAVGVALELTRLLLAAEVGAALP